MPPFVAREQAAQLVPSDLEVVDENHRLAVVADRVDLPSEPVPANADPEKLLQVFAILLDNAVRYSPTGGTVKKIMVADAQPVEFDQPLVILG